MPQKGKSQCCTINSDLCKGSRISKMNAKYRQSQPCPSLALVPKVSNLKQTKSLPKVCAHLYASLCICKYTTYHSGAVSYTVLLDQNLNANFESFLKDAVSSLATSGGKEITDFLFL